MKPRLLRFLGRLRTIGLFFLVPLLGSLAPLVLVPVVSGTFGSNTWASFAIALALGNAGAILAEVGWGVVGPQMIARGGGAPGLPSIYERAQASKLLAVIVVAPVAGVAAWVIAPDIRLEACAIAAATVGAALSPAWFFTGLGRPGAVLVCETLPRILGVAVSVAAIGIGAGPGIHAITLAAATGLGLWLATRLEVLCLLPTGRALRGAHVTISQQGFIVAGRAVSTVYTSLATVLIGLVAPGSVASFTAVDRPVRMGFTVLGAVPARLQSWIGSAAPNVRRRRSLFAVVINAAVGAAAAGVFVVITPVFAPVLFRGGIDVSAELVETGAALVAVMGLSRGLGLALVATGRPGDLTRAIMAAAALGVPAILLGARLEGSEGAMVGVVVAEMVGVSVQSMFLIVDGRRVGRPSRVRATRA